MRLRSRVIVLALAAVGLALGAGVVVSSTPEPVHRLPSEPMDNSRASRAFELTLAAPHKSADEIEAWIQASDELAARLESRGETDMSAAMRRTYRDVVVTEQDIEAFYVANARLFGARSLASARYGIEKLLRIHAVRVELALPEPDNGLVWP